MAENVQIPANRNIEIRSYTNAWFDQKAKLTFTEDGASSPFATWDIEGQGEGNQPMKGADFVNGFRWVSQRSKTYKVRVETWYRKDGTWRPHRTMPANSTLGLFNISTVLSEDDADKDWNDTVIQFTWWTPPGGG